MKKFFYFLLAFVLMLSLVACKGGNNENKKDNPDDDPIVTPPAEKILTFAEFNAAAVEDEVIIESYIQGKQIFNSEYKNTSLYLQDETGAYFVYRMDCTAEEYASLAIGKKVKISGTKAEWSGEVEITGAKFVLEEGTYNAPAKDVTSILGTDALKAEMNKLIAIKGAQVVASTVEGNDNEFAFLYKYDGSGEQGDDLYFNVKVGDKTYNLCVESDLCDKDSDAYKAAEALTVGDIIDLEGFAYWYNGLNAHINKIEVTKKFYKTMSYAEFANAELDATVAIESYIQGKQIYSEQYKNTSLYLQDEEGAYFVYRIACTAEEYAALAIGQKVKIVGTKAAWAGEVEIKDATFEILEGTKKVAATDITEDVADDDALIAHMNKFFKLGPAQVVASKIGEEATEYAYLYKYDGSGEDGDDLYFNVKVGEKVLTLTVETDLCDKDSDVYKAVKELAVGDLINVEGFAYWYNGLNAHITKVNAINYECDYEADFYVNPAFAAAKVSFNGEKVATGTKLVATLDAALTAAKDGDVIYLFAGDHVFPASSTLEKTLTFVGPNHGVKGTEHMEDEAVVFFDTLKLACGITLDGVYLNSASNKNALYPQANVGDIVIKNCITASEGSYNINSLIRYEVATTNPSKVVIKNNSFMQLGQFFVWIKAACGDAVQSVDIISNYFELNGAVNNSDAGMFRFQNGCGENFVVNIMDNYFADDPIDNKLFRMQTTGTMNIQYNTFRTITKFVSTSSNGNMVFNNNLYLNASADPETAVPAEVAGTGVVVDTAIAADDADRIAKYIAYAMPAIEAAYVADFNAKTGKTIAKGSDIDSGKIDSGDVVAMIQDAELYAKWAWLYDALYVAADEPDGMKIGAEGTDITAFNTKGFYLVNLNGFFSGTKFHDGAFGDAIDWTDAELRLAALQKAE